MTKRVEPQQFAKYQDSGAYHWRATYPENWRRSSPLLHARYDAALRKLAERMPLDRSLGLDLGCGDGVLLFKVSRAGGRIIGLDGMVDALRIAKRELSARGESQHRLLAGPATAIPLLSESVDYVLSLEVIEHVPDTTSYLTEVRRVLRPGGVLVITTPTRSVDGKLQDPYHCREYSASDLEALVRPWFSSVSVFGMYPRALSLIYERGSRVAIVDKLVRFGFKASSAMGWNPFERWITNQPTDSWNGLLAVCSK